MSLLTWEARVFGEAWEGSASGATSDEGNSQVELAGDVWAEVSMSVVIDWSGQLRVDCGEPDILCRGLTAMLPDCGRWLAALLILHS